LESEVEEYQEAIHYAEEPLGKIHEYIRIGRAKSDIKQPASCVCPPPPFLSLDSLKNTPGDVHTSQQQWVALMGRSMVNHNQNKQINK